MKTKPYVIPDYDDGPDDNGAYPYVPCPNCGVSIHWWCERPDVWVWTEDNGELHSCRVEVDDV